MTSPGRPALKLIAPDFASELADAILHGDSPELVNQVDDLKVWSRCACEDKFCGSFYVASVPPGPWSDLGEHHNVVLPMRKGMVILDVVDGAIRFVEVLDRPDVAAVVADLPPSPTR